MTVGYMTIGAKDVEAALPFFDAVLTPVGYARGPFEGGWAFYGKEGQPGIGICMPHDGQAARGGNGMMIGLKAGGQETVRGVYEAALANGGTDEGPPGFRPPDGTSFYGAYFRDAAGNKFCVYASTSF